MVGGEEEERKKGFPSFLLGLLFAGSKVAVCCCCCSCSYFLRLRVLTLLCRKPLYGAEIYFSEFFSLFSLTFLFFLSELFAETMELTVQLV